MIDINLFDKSFDHQKTDNGIYSITDNKTPSYIRYVEGKKGCSGITLFTDNFLWSTDGVEGIKIGWLIETRETNPLMYKNVESYIDNFDFLLTYDSELLERYPDKTKFYPFGGCWIPRDKYGFPDKTKLVSMIYSNKQDTSGHRLRHEIASQVSGVELLGSGAGAPFEAKEDVLSDCMFTIVIENTKNPYYFSEKLLDAMALGVIPIYYGATEIGKFFDVDGILTFDSIDGLQDILKRLSPELYSKMLPKAMKNQELLYKYDIQEDWIFENVLLKDKLVDQNMSPLSDIHNKHIGETLYILGNGVKLANISESERLAIETGVSIGTNACHLAFPETNYYITGHYVHLLFNYHFGKCENRFFQGEPDDLPEDTLKKMKTTQITDINVETSHNNLSRNVDRETKIIGAEQIGLAATHLAVLMGAKTIIYVGFDHKSPDHYYSFDPFKSKILDNISLLREIEKEDAFSLSDIDDFVNINVDPLSIPTAYHPNGLLPQYITDYRITLSMFMAVFSQARSYGISIKCIESDSIVADAGAEVVHL
jgi:hypothetical protein